ncbi:unnamed protein product [Moneuplotes crassus]|uniref:Uncharacterized protein n=1 Tax=Euplotes crassus TaxID=5936 RepID=A0AAD1UHJ6_EUPCR|nr:unnamed protein product [Moneuplotes crassus]
MTNNSYTVKYCGIVQGSIGVLSRKMHFRKYNQSYTCSLNTTQRDLIGKSNNFDNEMGPVTSPENEYQPRQTKLLNFQSLKPKIYKLKPLFSKSNKKVSINTSTDSQIMMKKDVDENVNHNSRASSQRSDTRVIYSAFEDTLLGEIDQENQALKEKEKAIRTKDETTTIKHHGEINIQNLKYKKDLNKDLKEDIDPFSMQDEINTGIPNPEKYNKFKVHKFSLPKVLHKIHPTMPGLTQKITFTASKASACSKGLKGFKLSNSYVSEEPSNTRFQSKNYFTRSHRSKANKSLEKFTTISKLLRTNPNQVLHSCMQRQSVSKYYKA